MTKHGIAYRSLTTCCFDAGAKETRAEEEEDDAGARDQAARATREGQLARAFAHARPQRRAGRAA